MGVFLGEHEAALTQLALNFRTVALSHMHGHTHMQYTSFQNNHVLIPHSHAVCPPPFPVLPHSTFGSLFSKRHLVLSNP